MQFTLRPRTFTTPANPPTSRPFSSRPSTSPWPKPPTPPASASSALCLDPERPPDDRRVHRAVEVLPHRQRVGVIGDGGGGGAGGGVGDGDARAAVPVHGLVGVEAQLLADALHQQVLLGGDA